MRDDFAVLICSHGRAETMTSYNMLRKQGYTGKIVIVIDDEDDQRSLYESRYDCVEVFSKRDYDGLFDEVVKNKNSVVYARHACFDIARKMGLEYFCQLDDDLTSLAHRYIEDKKAKGWIVNDLDAVFDGMLAFFNNPNVYCVSFVKNSAFIGGVNGKGFKTGFDYMANSIFFHKTDRRVCYSSTIYDDLNTGLLYNQRGMLFFSVAQLEFLSKEVGKTEGGASDVYEKFSPFTRAFSVLIARPDSVKIAADKSTVFRAQMRWDAVDPKILCQRWKK